MLSRHNLLNLLAALVALAVFLTACGPAAIQPVETEEPPGAGEPTPEEPVPTEPPPEPEPTPTPPPPEPTPTPPPPELTPTPPPAEPEPTTPPAEPQPTTPPPAEPPAEEGPSWDIGRLLLWGIVLAVPVGIIIGVIAFFFAGRGEEEEAPPEVPSVPVTTVAQDIKEGRVSKIVVSGEDLTITRTDGVVMASQKEPGADLVQLVTNLGVTPEMLGNVIIEVETPETPPS
jgi:hypothetical protein